MNRAVVVLSLALGLARGGLGLEVAHPVFFLSEPLVVWTAPGDGEVVVSYAGIPVPVGRWTKTPDGERIRWEAILVGPPGVWIACTDRACHAFLRVPDDVAVVEVLASPRIPLALAGQRKVADRSGRAFFIVPPGKYDLGAEWGGEAVVRAVAVGPGERTTLTLALAAAGVSTPVALPGSTVTLTVRLVSPRDAPSAEAELTLPVGWEATPAPGVYDPLRAGRLAVRTWRVTVPDSALPGEYTVGLAFPALGMVAQATLAVARYLPPWVVVCHWDVTADRLDLSLPCAITYARLRWAATFVGRELPFTGRVFTRSELEALAAEWQRGP